MRRRLGHNFSSESDDEINLTPLIDVVFIVLITFILIAPMIELDHVELAGSGPRSEQVSAHQDQKLIIRVRDDNSIWFDQTPVSCEQLTSILKSAREKNPLGNPRVFHDKRASFGTYQSVKSAIEKSGFEEMDVILKP